MNKDEMQALIDILEKRARDLKFDQNESDKWCEWHSLRQQITILQNELKREERKN